MSESAELNSGQLKALVLFQKKFRFIAQKRNDIRYSHKSSLTIVKKMMDTAKFYSVNNFISYTKYNFDMGRIENIYENLFNIQPNYPLRKCEELALNIEQNLKFLNFRIFELMRNSGLINPAHVIRYLFGKQYDALLSELDPSISKIIQYLNEMFYVCTVEIKESDNITERFKKCCEFSNLTIEEDDTDVNDMMNFHDVLYKDHPIIIRDKEKANKYINDEIILSESCCNVYIMLDNLIFKFRGFFDRDPLNCYKEIPVYHKKYKHIQSLIRYYHYTYWIQKWISESIKSQEIHYK